MMSRKIPLAILIVFTAWGCRKGPLLTVNDLASLGVKGVTEITVQKVFDVDPSAGLENVIIAKSETANQLVVVKRKEKEDVLLWQRPLANDPLLKLAFVQPGKPQSYVMVLTKAENVNLHILGHDSFEWRKRLQAGQASQLFIKKKDDKAKDDIIIIGETEYRYNGFEYAPFDIEGPLPVITRVSKAGNEHWIELKNTGSYSSRGILTIGFPDLTAEQEKQLALTRDIPTVKLYRKGSMVHKNGGGRVALTYPIIEVVKEPFASGASIKLPLMIPEGAKSVLVRMAYTMAGRTSHWPLPTELTEKDGQGFEAYRKMLD